MKRKVVLLGNSTYVVSLPAKWMKHHQLQKGDEVWVETQDDDLIVQAFESKTLHTPPFKYADTQNGSVKKRVEPGVQKRV